MTIRSFSLSMTAAAVLAALTVGCAQPASPTASVGAHPAIAAGVDPAAGTPADAVASTASVGAHPAIAAGMGPAAGTPADAVASTSNPSDGSNRAAMSGGASEGSQVAGTRASTGSDNTATRSTLDSTTSVASGVTPGATTDTTTGTTTGSMAGGNDTGTLSTADRRSGDNRRAPTARSNYGDSDSYVRAPRTDRN